MKNFTKEFKNKALFRPTRWLLVALMFLLGTCGAWAATISSDGTARLYFNMSSINWWIAGTNGNGNFAYFFNNSTGKNSWSAHSVKHDGNTYYVTIPKGDWAGVILTRNNTSTAPSWNNKWNQTGDITLSSTSNYISKFSEGSTSVTWGTAVKPASTASVTAASTSIKVGESTTLSAALTSNTDLNTLSSTSYTTTTGASINGDTFTATTPGTYTVTATVTYHPNAYSSLTSTVETTVTITVTDPCPSSVTPGTASGAKTICSEGSATVSLSGNTSGSAIQWQKSTTSTTSGFNDIANAKSDSYTASNLTQTTYFRAVVTLSKTGCDTKTAYSNVVSITVNPIPSAPYNGVAQSTTICAGSSYTFDSKYIWYTSETGTTTVYGSKTINSKTDYYISQKSNNCESARTKYTVNVDTKPAITLKTAPTICEGSTITFSDYVQPSTGTITWHTDANCNEAAITSATPSQTTTYYVKATNGVCDPVTSSLKVTVSEKSKLTLKAAPTICNGATIAFPDYVDNNNTIGTVSWYLDEDRTQSAGVTAKPSQTTTYYAKAVSGVCDPATAELKVTVNDKPAKPTLGASNTALVAGDNAILTVSNTETGATYTLYKDGVSTGKTGTSFTVNDAGSYTVKGKNDCGESDASTAVVITVCNPIKSAKLYFADSNYNKLDACPTYCAGSTAYFVLEYTGERDGDKTWTRSDNFATNLKGTEEHYYFTINTSGSISVTIPTCDGTSVTTNTLTYPVGNVTLAPVAPTVSVITNEVITCNETSFVQKGKIQITNYSANNDYIIGDNDNSPVNVSVESGKAYIYFDFGGTFTLKARNKACSLIGPKSAQFTITESDKTPTITGKTITQPGKKNAIELTLPTGINAKWSVEPNNADLSVNEGNSTLFSAEVENDYVITANNDGCIDTHNVKVSTAFLIWVRRPMSGHASYENIYSGTSEKGSALYLEQTTSGQTYTSVDNVANRNSSAHNKIEPESSYTDCEGATWDIFRTTPEMALAGAKFYVAAKNDEKTNGYATYTKDYTFANGMTADAYFTIGGHTSGNKGSEIVLSEQPLPTNVYSSGDAKFNANNFADFVPLYVVDCSGNEVDSFQWQFSATIDGAYTNYSSECSYVGKKTETTDAGKSNNIRVKEGGYYRCIVTYKDGKGTSTSNSIKVTNTTSGTPGTLSFTSELPIIMVNTNDLGFPVNNFGGSPSKNADKMKEKMSVDVKIYEGSTLKYDRKARMNYRGSSSLNFLKKSYAFCPGKADCVEDKGRKDYVKTEKLNMLGIGEAVDKDWVLYAAAADPSLMRNRLMFDTFADMTGGWSVSSRYVELVVNGEYKGVYVMMDKITANKDRVNVEWKLDANGNTTQEAFIVKFDKTDKADRYEITSGDQKTFKSKYSGHDGFDTYDTNIDQRFEVEYPEKEDIEDGKGKWSEVFNAIENKINKFEEELAKGNFSEVQKLIDYTSWADWFIITEFAKNIDGYRASNLFVYDGSKPNAKIEARPLWDQELSFNNQCPSYYADYGSNSTSGLLIDKSNSAVYNNDASAPFWFTGKYKGDRGKYNGSDQTFKGLLDDPCFVAEVQVRWAKHIGTNGALTSSALTTKMTGYLKDLDKNHDLSSSAITSGTPLDREFNTFWKNKSRATIDCGTGSGCYSGTTGYTDPTFHNSKVSLNNWLTGNRRTNLGNIINGWKGTELNITLTITPETGITTPWEAVVVQVNNPSGYDYDLEYTTNTLDKVSGVIINENNDKYTYRIPRPEAWKPGDEEKDGERTDIQYGIKATLKVGEGVAQCGNSSQAPSATTTITLQDEANENCPKP